MELVEEILQKTAREAEKYKTTEVKKHLDVEFDVGDLLVFDKNDLDNRNLSQSKEDYLLNLTRDNIQLLVNQVWKLPTERVDDAIVVKLPPHTFVLPRAKRVPKPKPLTKWQKFAKEKGITKKKRSKLSWDEQLQKWVPLYGFKRSKAEKEKDWVLEVPQNANPLEDQFAKKAEAKTERVAKNELQRLRNLAKAKNVKVPRMGITNVEVSSSKDLSAAVTVAKSSTASIGKFQDKLPKEKEARGVTDITPGASRKRKMPPVSGSQEKSENLAAIESVLNKKPKLDIEKAVDRHINQENMQRSQEGESRKGKGKGGGRDSGSQKGKGNKKQKGGKGQRKGKKGGSGRKRR